MGRNLIAVMAAACFCARAQEPSPWVLTRSANFEVFSQGGSPAAKPVCLWLEQLRAFFLLQTGLKLHDATPVRLIGFRGLKEYEAYRLKVASDAYYVSTGSRDYIVLPSLGTADFGVAAHEYAHFLLRASGLRLPAWLSEGLAEFFSTVRIDSRGSSIGGDIPGRSQILRQRPWIPLAQLLTMAAESPLDQTRDRASVWYAESWALADLLMVSPDYRPRFPALVAALMSGQSGPRALSSAYGRGTDLLDRDLHAWVEGRRSHAVPLATVAAAAASVETAPVSSSAARALLADLLLAIGELDRAESMYRELERETPADPEIPAALGALALKRGDPAGARREWKRALALGINDAALCYRYATLASAANVPPEEVRQAYERAIALNPDLDDARYALALVQKNSGEYEAALANLRALRTVAPSRAFHYWSALADALTQLGQRDEAVSAARQAAAHASSAQERSAAAQLAYMAQTEIATRFVRGADGVNQLVLTRVPRDTADWNPFVEPTDDVRRLQATLREIECGEVTRFLLDSPAGPLALAIPDLSRLQARNAPAEFTCGPQPATPVTVVYAARPEPNAQGVLRGIEFR